MCRQKFPVTVILFALVAFVACAPATPTPAPTATPAPTVTLPPSPTAILIPTSTATATSTPVPPTKTPTPTETATSTPMPWASISIPEASPQEQSLYLLSLLEEKGYGDLVPHLKGLPEINDGVTRDDVRALTRIVALAVTSTNPEVKEAFEMMVNGGVGNQVVGYGSRWNSQLRILFWLALQNEFKRNDTLVQAIALSNGIWEAMGDEQVTQSVRADVNALFKFFRETNEFQIAKGFSQLEEYPLEVKIALAWTGNESMRNPPPGSRTNLTDYKDKAIPLKVYDTITVSIPTLIKMREQAEKMGWLNKDVNYVVMRIENYIYFPMGPVLNHRKDFNAIVNESGLRASNDIDWQYRQYTEGHRFQGDCATEMSVVDAWLKSLGIGTLNEWTYTIVLARGEKINHSFIIYFDPADRTWKAYQEQIGVLMLNNLRSMGSNEDQQFDFFVDRPPANLRGYLKEEVFHIRIIDGKQYSYDHWVGNMYYQLEDVPYRQIRVMLQKGIPTLTMKQWLFP